MKKKGYFVQEKDGDFGFPVVATSAKEAKKIAFALTEMDCDYIDVRATWKRNAEVEDLQVGYVDDEILALCRGLCDYLNETECECCNRITSVSYCNARLLCSKCSEKEKSN